METLHAFLFFYLSVSFIYLGWQLDIIEERIKNSQEKNSAISKSLAILKSLFWIILLFVLIVNSIFNSIRSKIREENESYETIAKIQSKLARLII